MRVKCVSNNPQNAAATHKYLGSSTGTNQSTYLLTIDKEYAVYATARIGKETIYLICDDAQGEEELLAYGGEPDPAWYDANLFEILDSWTDPSWQTAQGTIWTRDGQTMSFPEFVEDASRFYHKLLEGEPKEVETFLRYVDRYSKPHA